MYSFIMQFTPGRIKYPVAEGCLSANWMQCGLSGFDVSNAHVLEVGPKHGIHTQLIDAHEPKSITVVELEDKRGVNNSWLPRIKSDIEVFYTDLLRFSTEKRFDLILFTGVLYHNIEQIRLLKKLYSLASPGCRLVFESATTRNPVLQDLNVIEVHWPNAYRNTPTIRFLPSKQACMSMLEMSGWRILDTSDLYPEYTNPDRVNIVCEAVADFTLRTYQNGEVDHSYIDD